MKNIHILPTSQPSRLQRFTDVDKIEFELASKDEFFNKGMNIYITSDEEIKERDWCYDSLRKIICKCIEVIPKSIKEDDYLVFEGNTGNPRDTYKKIILTTDQDLIKDGVQAIDDEFLEWFIKNPSCERVGVERDSREVGGHNGGVQIEYGYYEIIIPSEEPKNICIQTGLPCGMQCLSEDTCNRTKSKQETLEEASSTVDKIDGIIFDLSIADKVKLFDLIETYVKEEQERMYSEEEVESIIQKLMNDVHCGDLCYGDNVIDFKLSPRQWFEQFKKK
jgi:hypothetical protein